MLPCFKLLGRSFSVKPILKGLTISREIHLEKKIGILGLPFSAGQVIPGVCKGPDAIRNGGLIQKLEYFGMTVKDFGNLDLLPEEIYEQKNDESGMRQQETVGRYCKKVSEAVAQIENDGYTCVTLGGDHSTAIGTIHGHLVNNPDTSVIYVDAHADINTISSSISRNANGMPLSFLIEGLHSYNSPHPAFDWVSRRISPRNVAYIGLRDVDPLERYILNKWGIRAYDMRDVDKYGILHIVEMVLEGINPKGNRPVHVSFDIDAMDGLLVPSTAIPIPGGLTMREGLYLAEELAKSGNLCGLDLVEVNPTLGSPSDVTQTVKVAHQLIAGFFGSQRGGNVPIDVHDSEFVIQAQPEVVPLKQETKI